MSKATYLHALSTWALNGSRGCPPSSQAHGISLSDLTSDESSKAIDAGDPRPPAISNWTWWDGTHRDLHAWHNALRAHHAGGPTLTAAERQQAEATYAQTHLPESRPRPLKRGQR